MGSAIWPISDHRATLYFLPGTDSIFGKYWTIPLTQEAPPKRMQRYFIFLFLLGITEVWERGFWYKFLPSAIFWPICLFCSVSKPLSSLQSWRVRLVFLVLLEASFISVSVLKFYFIEIKFWQLSRAIFKGFNLSKYLLPFLGHRLVLQLGL